MIDLKFMFLLLPISTLGLSLFEPGMKEDEIVELQPIDAYLSSTLDFPGSQYGSFDATECINRVIGLTADMCHSASEKYPYLVIDLGKPTRVSKITIFNRSDGWGYRFQDVDIRISDQRPIRSSAPNFDGVLVGSFEGPGQTAEEIPFSTNTTGQYVVIVLNTKGNLHSVQLNLAEVKILGYQEEEKKEENCGAGWSTYEESCFKVVNSSTTWNKAQWYCIQEGGNLASVHDVATNNFILGLITTGNNFWLGGYSVAHVWTWKWADSTDFNYMNWKNGKDYGKDCMAIANDQDGKWNDVQCVDTDTVSGFVCQK